MDQKEQKEIRVFYSWQSDSPKETNLNFIRESLRNASNQIESKNSIRNFRIKLDEATRNVPGSPNIPETIFSKIKVADIFICDVTTINPNAQNNERKVPNPNVLIELGFAICELGWSRVIMLFNKSFGDLSEAPFDINRQRLSDYNCSLINATSNNKNNFKKKLEQLLEEAIFLIINNDPLRPKHLNKKTEEEIKKERDEETLKELFTELHIPTLHEFIYKGPNYIPDPLLFFWEGFNEIVTRKHFYLYDERLKTNIINIHRELSKALSHDDQYHMTSSGMLHVFTNDRDLPLPANRQAVWDEIQKSLEVINANLNDLLENINKYYLQIDLKELISNSWKRYIRFVNETKELLK